ncbi:hypothetical protein [Oceanithermus sp.]
MKRIGALVVLLTLSLTLAQNNASTSVPVTVLGYDLNVVWPAPTLQVFGPDCDNAARAAFVMAHELNPRVPEEVERHACYRLLVSGPDKQATTVNFIAGYTRQGAGYTLTFEKSSADGRLLQVWEKQKGPALIYIFTFGDKQINLVVGQVELAAANEG